MDTRDIRYYVNEEKKTVAAVIDNCAEDAVADLMDKFSNSFMPNLAMLIIPDTLKAKVKCHPDDEWNEEIGKQVAKEKLIKKYNRAKANAIKDYITEVSKFVAEASAIEGRIRARSL